MTESTYVGYNCFATFNAFKAVGKTGKEPKIGALVIFTFSHMGRVLDIYERNGKKYIEIWEGNTSSDLNDRNGGMVKIRERYAYDSTIKGYCYIDYDEAPISYSTEKISVGKSGLRVTANLNIRNNPGASGTKVIGSYKENEWIHPYEKTFISGKPWYHTDKGWISANYVEGWVYEETCKLWWFVMDGYSCTINNWQKIGDNWCFFNASGWLVQSEWVDWKGKSYYLDKDGYMATNAYIKSKDKNVYYYVNSEGVWNNKSIKKLPSNATVVI
jgi:glucan-binding YG repeat protein